MHVCECEHVCMCVQVCVSVHVCECGGGHVHVVTREAGSGSKSPGHSSEQH